MENKSDFSKNGINNNEKNIDLINAEKTIAFQNKEKDKRAAELVIANHELVLQNEEKEKRVAELLSIKKELQKAHKDIRKLNDLKEKTIKHISRLESSNKDLESFAYSVSHDFFAPLRSIQTYISMIKAKYGSQLDTGATRLMDIITRKAKKMTHLISHLLSFARYSNKEL